MKTQHTPAPWEIQEHDDGFNIDSAFNQIADVFNTRLNEDENCMESFYEESKANARLIAAAPELLELCEESLRALHEDDFPILKDKIRTAIAKATTNH